MPNRLKDLPLFAGLRTESIEALTDHLPRRTFKKGQKLFQQGERRLEVYILIEGKVEVLAEGQDGRSAAIVFHQAPYLIGTIEIWRERPSLGSVIALEPCEVLVMSKREFLKFLNSNHQVCLNMVQHMSNLLYKTAKDRRILLFGEVDHLVANLLCYFAQLYGEEKPFGTIVRKELNKSEIAQTLGVARRSVIRAMDSLSRDGLLEVDGKQLVIPSLEALKRRAQTPVVKTV